MAEAPIDQAEAVSAALDRCMRDASAIVLRGYELPTDVQLIGERQEHQRYYDDRGEAMWNTVMNLVNKLERERSAG
jgi:DNA polymerase-1